MGTEPTAEAAGPAVQASSRPALAAHVRRSYDRVREQDILLGPEAVTVLNPTGAAIVDLCDGQRSVTEVVDELRETYDGVADEDVEAFLARLVAKRYVELDGD